MYSSTILVGRLGHDPESKTTKSGDSLCKLSIATNGTWFDSDGIKKESTTWHSITAWKGLADICKDHLKKGDLVFIEGEIINSSWTDENGRKHQSSEIKAKRILFFNTPKSEK